MKIFKRRGETFLPDEIVEQILWKLPTKSVLRFKSVHKRWLYLISQSNFAQSQLKHVLSADDERKLMVLSSDCSQCYVVNQHGKTVDHKYNLPSALLASAPPPPDSVHILGSCNGLLCIGIFSHFDHKRDIFDSNWDVHHNPILWNPVLNDYKKVPFSVSNISTWFGFGYDSHTQDYKFVKIRMNLSCTGYVEVYSLKSSSIRRFHLRNLKLYGMRSGCWVGRFFNGSLYWLSYTRRYDTPTSYIDKPYFLVFDLRYDTFRIVKFPNCTLPKEGGNFAVVRDCDCLGVFFYDHKYIKLLTIKKDDKEEGNCSWSSNKIRQPKGNISYPLCFMKNIEEILVRLNNKFPDPENTNNDEFIYNPQRRTKEVAAAEIHRPGDGYEVKSPYTTYIQTLVSPSKL